MFRHIAIVVSSCLILHQVMRPQEDVMAASLSYTRTYAIRHISSKSAASCGTDFVSFLLLL